MPKPPLPLGAHELAHAQAHALAKHAEVLAHQISQPTDPGLILAYLVNAGLAIELYLKAFMICARGGQVTSGHDLSELLAEFPTFLRKSFNTAYEAHPTAKSASIGLVAFRISPTAPERPTSNSFTGRYTTFDEAVESLSDVFVESRYFFERLVAPEWAIFSYPTDAISGVIHALEETYQIYKSGGFKGAA